MTRLNTGPIGIFDSGVGGLTVAAAVKQILPEETIIYFGDTAHLPYGDKSSEAILHYSKKISDFLLGHNCRVILAACNTVSATVWSELESYIGERAIAVNVIDPVANRLANTLSGSTVGVIGTKNTVNSGAYPEKINKVRGDVRVRSLATPLLVPMIEEGFVYDDISNAIIRTYLSDSRLKGIDTLILGCTHYPIIRNQIRKFYDFKVDVIDSAMMVAEELRDLIEKNEAHMNGQAGCTGAASRECGDVRQGNTNDAGDFRHGNTKDGGDVRQGDPVTGDRFFVSDHTEYFSRIAAIFFEKEIALEKHDLWK
ncbi:MAG: glutamate racemase [Marinilabiliales bacterium]|nr:MAG: glutamate racemase [Marinilabiliales bacterium]